MGSGDVLRGLVARELAARTEPWARKLLDPLTGQAHADVVTALAQVAAGLERDEDDEPASRENLVGWLVDTALVDPSNARSAERPQFQTAVRVQFENRGARRPTGRAMNALVELVLGAHGQEHPRALRVASPELVVDEYLRGGDASSRQGMLFETTETIEVTAVPLATPPVPPRKAPARRASGTRRTTPKRRPAVRARAGVKSKKPAAKKPTGRKKSAVARRTSSKRSRAARPRKRVATKKPSRTRKRATAKHARRKKK
jgi:hypothetical protein